MAIKRVRGTYLYTVLDPDQRPKVLEWTIRHARYAKDKHGVDGIVFRGMSGAIVAPTVADAIGLPLIMIRKPTVDQHSSAKLEGYRLARRVMIIDDVIVSGDTMYCIKNVLFGKTAKRVNDDNMYKPAELKVVAAILFADMDFDLSMQGMQSIFDDTIEFMACGQYDDVADVMTEKFMNVCDVEVACES